ncbi:hypothetical protein GYMLUDRAFT_53634 [Collybiopsis luxurians FD-317 M1]|nr:hypothetical protein GYMLUDRAFT_53634 [Collybiopsis luxurians FD-317 M1]
MSSVDIRLGEEKEFNEAGFHDEPLRRVQRLPLELLNLIFLSATPPAFLMIPDDRRPHSAWNLSTRTKMQLIKVCRDWYDAGINLLYEDLVVFSIGSLSALMSTLRDKSYLAERVRSVRFSCVVPEPYVTMFERIIISLPTLCPNLAGISIQQSFALEGSIVKVFPHLGALSLTCLEVSDSVPFDVVRDNMHLFAPRLVSLSMRSQTSEYSAPPSQDCPVHLQFPSLKAFHCQLGASAVKFVCRHWTFPVLETLACAPPSTYLIVSDLADILDQHLAFIEKHGNTVKTLFLLFPEKYLGVDYTSPMQNVIEDLPLLRHLVIPLFLDVTFPQVQWLDCFLSEDDGRSKENLSLLSDERRKSRFPNLQSFRFIEMGLLTLPFIYTLLPPSGGECRFRFPGIDIHSSTSSILGMSTGDARCLSSKSTNNLDFSSETESGAEDGSSESESDVDESDGVSEQSEDEVHSNQSWTGDEETALEAWRMSHVVSDS